MTFAVPDLLAVIPAHNESASIAAVVTGAVAHLPVLVVDDGSRDDTAEQAAAAGAFVHRQQPNQGKGAALRTGFSWALARHYEAVITLDADGQHDPADLPGFLTLYRSQPYDLIIGQRDFSQIPAVRRLANTLGRWSFSWAVGQPIPDNQSGYRLLSRRMLAATLASSESGFEFEVEMIVRCLELGYRLGWTPIRTIYAGESSHIHGWHHTVHFTRMVWQTRQRRRK